MTYIFIISVIALGAWMVSKLYENIKLKEELAFLKNKEEL